MKKHRIAVIPGDGIGNEVVPEGIRVLEAAGRKFGVEFQWDRFPWSCEYYKNNGRMMPEDGLAQIRRHDAIFLGAVGFPGVPDHVSLWGLLIPIRREFQRSRHAVLIVGIAELRIYRRYFLCDESPALPIGIVEVGKLCWLKLHEQFGRIYRYRLDSCLVVTRGNGTRERSVYRHFFSTSVLAD